MNEGNSRNRPILGISTAMWSCICLFMVCELLAAQSAGTDGSAAQKTTGSIQALLMRGSESWSGVPGFGPNAFPALFGEYRRGEEPSTTSAPIFVWATRVALYLDPKVWRTRRLGSYRLYEQDAAMDDEELVSAYRASMSGSVEPRSNILVALDRPFASVGQGAVPNQWSIVFALPSGTPDSFISAFLVRFSYFLSSAKLPTDVSFPATIAK